MCTSKEQDSRKKYPGFYECIYHDFITEWLKSMGETVCKTCFGLLSAKKMQVLACLIYDGTRRDQDIYRMQEQIEKLESTLDKAAERM